VRVVPGMEAASFTRAIVDDIRHEDGDLPVTDVATMEQIAREPMAQQRMILALVGSFSALALVLATIGTYSVLSYAVAERRREIGLRLALGAQRLDVLRLVAGGGVRLAALGIVVGIAGAFALTRLMTDLLFGVPPTDPITFLAVSALLGLTSAVACYVPVRRAMGVNPVEVLRQE